MWRELGVTLLAGSQAGPSERLEACMLCALTFRGPGFWSACDAGVAGVRSGPARNQNPGPLNVRAHNIRASNRSLGPACQQSDP